MAPPRCTPGLRRPALPIRRSPPARTWPTPPPAPGLLLIGRGDAQGEQVSQSVDGRMHLRALLALGPVVARAVAAFGRRAQRAAVEDRRRRVGRATGSQPQSRTRRSWTIASKTPAASHLLACW